MRWALGVVAATATMLALPGVASAATVTASEGQVSVAAAAGETNTIEVIHTTNGFLSSVTVTDTTTPLTTPPTLTCELALSLHEVACTFPGPLSAFTATLDDESDSIDATGLDTTGLGGVDVSVDTSLDGGGGDDVLTSGDGNDVLSGSAGDDQLDGNGGADVADYAGSPDHSDPNGVSGGFDVVVDLGSGEGTDEQGVDTIADVEDVQGSPFADSLIGDGAGNGLNGGGGDDSIEGMQGDDALDGGTGEDTASFATTPGTITADLTTGQATGSGTGTDTLANFDDIAGSGADDTLTGDGASNDLSGGPGTDTIFALGGDDTISGEGGADELDGGEDNDEVDGGDGTDIVSGAAGMDRLDGGAEGDGLDGGAGNDDPDDHPGAGVHGGSGDDTILAADGDDQLAGDLGTDTINFAEAGGPVVANMATSTGAGTDTYDGVENLFGSPHADQLTGDDGANRLTGGESDDALNGGGNDDTLVGGSGDDAYDGEAGGGDRAIFAGAPGPVDVDLQAGTATGAATTQDTLSEVENVTGSGSGDTIRASDAQNAIDAGAGDDTVFAVTSAGSGAGNDTFVGGTGSDQLRYDESTSAHTFDLTQSEVGGDGTDDGFSGFELYFGSGHADTFNGGAEADTFDGLGGADTISGGTESDTLTGSGGDDTLAGEGDDDSYFGGAGEDRASFAGSANAVNIDLGVGMATGDGGGEVLDSIEEATGSAFADTFRASDFANDILGGNGDDTFFTADADGTTGGSDSFQGGAGDSDLLTYEGSDSAHAFSVPGGAVSGDGTADSFAAFESYRATANDGDSFTGGPGPETFEGLDGDDSASGGAGADDLDGDGGGTVDFGADRLSGGPGDDALWGGGGGPGITDTVDYSAAPGPITADLEVPQEASEDGDGSSDELHHFDRIVGSDFGDEISNSDGSGDAVEIEAGSGDDLLRARNSLEDTLRCGAGTDRAITDFNEADVDLCETDDDPAQPITPSITGSNPGSGANDNSPEITGTAPLGSSVRLYKSSDCTGSPAATGSSADFAGAGITVAVADNSTTTLTADVTSPLDSDGASACSSAFTYEERTPAPPAGPDPEPNPDLDPDTSAPNTTIARRIKKTKDGTPAYAFSASEEGSTFECSVDGGAFEGCASPHTLKKLKKGKHTFAVRATDAAGNTDSTPAEDAFTVKRKKRRTN